MDLCFEHFIPGSRVYANTLRGGSEDWLARRGGACPWLRPTGARGGGTGAVQARPWTTFPSCRSFSPGDASALGSAGPGLHW